MSLSDDSGPRPCAWTARSWLANKHGGHFLAVRSSSFDLPLYDQAEIDRLSARIAELHECLTKCAESAYEAGVADERERHAKLRTVAVQVLRDMRAHGLLLEWQTLLDEAL